VQTFSEIYFRHARGTYLLLREIVRKVCNHDLVLGWDTVGRGTALATGLTGRCLAILGLSGCGYVSGVSQGKGVARRSDSLCTFLTLGLAEN
jgi:hypothetical protein